MNITRREAIRKCIVIFEALRRITAKGNAGLEAARGAEEAYDMNVQILDHLRGILREMEAGTREPEVVRAYRALQEEQRKTEELIPAGMADWQKEIIEAGGPPERMCLR